MQGRLVEAEEAKLSIEKLSVAAPRAGSSWTRAYFVEEERGEFVRRLTLFQEGKNRPNLLRIARANLRYHGRKNRFQYRS